jgi:NAD(P)-dependent dehydrogenase (short-subunit alcohol dehydrogenase family)/GNAT superfamily N-acetyltransferase
VSSSVSKTVLITGCSSGIGRATAELLGRDGWAVYATARRLETIEDLATAGCRLVQLDVCDEVSMQAAIEIVERERGAVDVLVNNAGYGQEGAVEDVPVAELRRQFETNLFGPHRLTRLVLPGMRHKGWGRIVNVSSMGGKVTFPGGGAYHASKHALEAISDALRYEVRPFGVDVVVIEPGLVKTRFGETSVGAIDTVSSDSSPYRDFNAGLASVRGRGLRRADGAPCGRAGSRRSGDREVDPGAASSCPIRRARLRPAPSVRPEDPSGSDVGRCAATPVPGPRRQRVKRPLPGGYELDDDRDRIDVRETHRFLSTESYWARGRPFEVVERPVREASRVVGLYRDGAQVGFARVVSDGAAFAYLADVYVLPEHRGRGLGLELAREAVEGGTLAETRWLLHTDDAHELYRKLGFGAPSRLLMERPRRVTASPNNGSRNSGSTPGR